MTHYTQADLDMANRHIAEGELRIVRQERLMTRLRMQSLPTKTAEDLLETFYMALAECRVRRAAIIDALTA